MGKERKSSHAVVAVYKKKEKKKCEIYKTQRLKKKKFMEKRGAYQCTFEFLLL